MAKSFQCSHAGVPCSAEITAESEEEVLEQAVEHAREKHGVDLTASQGLVDYARGLIEDTDGPRDRATDG